MDAEEKSPKSGHRILILLLALVVLLLIAGASFLWLELRRMREEANALGQRVEALTAESRDAANRATSAERSALEAARGRAQAEVEASTARSEADTAKGDANAARSDARMAEDKAEAAEEKAKAAEAEAARVRAETEAETQRLQNALSQIAETRRTALGLVMNLGSDYLKFDFDKAEVRPENRELLSRVAGILMTAKDYHITVQGHTDDVGTEAYNQTLSEKRADAVRDYLVKAGISADVVSTEGAGKSRPLVPGTSETARAKNRRVEIGIVSTRIDYPRTASPKKP